MASNRLPTLQTVSWFVDLFKNGQLTLDPPFQRLSFWNQQYRDFFVDTLLNGFPVPPVFLHQRVSDDGRSHYEVVDGKQRIETILMFANSELPVPESIQADAGKYFADLPKDVRDSFWSNLLPVEILFETNEPYLKEVFDRINRNVGKLRRQELRHARHDGAFALLADRAATLLQSGLPAISDAEKRRMRDVEYTAQLLVYLAQGAQSTSQDDLDRTYAEWDPAVPEDLRLEERYIAAQAALTRLVGLGDPNAFAHSRFRNLADHYGLFGAVADLSAQGWQPSREASSRLVEFSGRVEAIRPTYAVGADPAGTADPTAARYYGAVRAASNDAGPRNTRIEILKGVIRGE